MRKNKLVLNLVLAVAAVAAMVALQAVTGSSGPVPAVEASGGSGCEGDVKIDGDGPTTFNAPAGESISSVCIKAGRDTFTYACGETDTSGCYSLDWTEASAGCCTAVTVGGGGTGRDCKSISHTAATFGGPPCVEPSPTPSPEPSPSPSPEPSPEPSPDPSPDPEE